ncbi:MAG: helix-turn-helix domain-containing protein [Treponema sp.]|nr:helix-turn-helix domain-containing protein [Treponema sp.]
MEDQSLARSEGDPRIALGKLSHFCRSTGIGGYVMDDEGLVLGLIDGEGNLREGLGTAEAVCPVCKMLGPEETENELRAQLYGAWQAERIGGKYIHLCAHSLLYIVAPVFEEGALWAAFVVGPLMIVEPAEILADLRTAGFFPEGRESELSAALEAVPRVSPRRATSVAELLADLAAATGGAMPEPIEAAREREELESRISERIHDLKDDSETAPPYPIEREHELLNAISRGDKPDSQRLLNDILGHIFFASGRNPAIIRARVLELVVLISRAALDGGADVERIFDLGFTYLNQVQKMRSVEDIALWLSRVMNRFSDLVFNLSDVKHADVMMKAMRYINARFDKPITLDEVAEAVSLSPTYFSKIWNEEMKCRFTAYLNKLRIERARVLLRTTDTPLVEIAGLLGYEDQSYFNKVFKKLVGLSPGRFRESAGRAPKIAEIHE